MKGRTEQYQDKVARLFPQTHADGRTALARTVTFAVTDACTLRCTYCYQGIKAGHYMKLETAKKFIRLLLDGSEYINAENSPALIMEFIGGEPLLAIELIDQITDFFIEEMILRQHPWATRYMISICSNGTLYFNPNVQEYIKKHLHHLSFSVSVDGNKALHDTCRVFPDGSGSYDAAIAAVRHYVDVLGGRMGSKMTLCPENVDKTCEAVVGLLQAGYREIFLNCVYEEGWTNEHGAVLYCQLKALADYIFSNDLWDKVYISMFERDFFRPKDQADVRNWCGGAGDMVAVDYTGNIYPCIRYMPNALGEDAEPLVIGSVDRGIMADENGRKCVECLRKVNRRTQSTDECFECPIAEGCSWCSAYNYQKFGTVDHRATFICPMHKARALANVYFWNKGNKLAGKRDRMKNHVPEKWALEIINREEWEMLKELEVGDDGE